MANLISLLRSNSVPSVTYVGNISVVSPMWDDECLPWAIIELDCSGLNLESIPSLPQCLKLNCSNNRLTKLPDLPQVKFLNCRNNRLTSIPSLPTPSLPNLQMVWSEGNPLGQSIKDKSRPFWVPISVPWDDQVWRSIQIPIDHDLNWEEIRNRLEFFSSEPGDDLMTQIMALGLIRQHLSLIPAETVNYYLSTSTLVRDKTPDLFDKLTNELRGGAPVWLLPEITWRQSLAEETRLSPLFSENEKGKIVTSTIQNFLDSVSTARGRTNKLEIIVVLYKFILDQRWFCYRHPKFRLTVENKLREFVDDHPQWSPMFLYLLEELRSFSDS